MSQTKEKILERLYKWRYRKWAIRSPDGAIIGLSTPCIAEDIGMSPATVRKHIKILHGLQLVEESPNSKHYRRLWQITSEGEKLWRYKFEEFI